MLAQSMENKERNDTMMITTELPPAVNNTMFTVHLGKLL
jgi:hypothetical protein